MMRVSLTVKERKMQLEEFDTKWNSVGMKHYIDMHCSDCGCERTVLKEKARATIIRKGRYLCRSCSMKQRHKDVEFSEDRKENISRSLKGIKRSAETREKMSEAKLEFYKTQKGLSLKNKLSHLASQAHAENKFENKKRQGWHQSGKAGLIFYGSSYELRLCHELDADPSVKTYRTQISYQAGERWRCLDCLVTYTDGNNKSIEVKPESRLCEQANIDQINDSREFAESQGWNFEVYTEKTFGMTNKELRDWSDVVRSHMGDFDWVAFRKELNQKKANNHYHKNIANDKVTVFCSFCQMDHAPLRLTHDKNIARNGRYICEREGGHMAGSRPKPHLQKDNPHLADGKKECLKCKVILDLAEFGVDKGRRDGLSSRCKKCRAASAKSKYKSS